MNLKYLIAAFVSIVGANVVLNVSTTHAVSATDFQAGHIIDDAVFYNKAAMGSAQAVQDFITSHTPTCDTWGTQPSEYGGGTRAQYAASVGWPGPPYVCLQNYYENPTTGETSYEKGGGVFDGGKSAGQIIWDAAQQYSINPQVLLVMLKKESAGPLFSDSWPLKSQYKYAMGYACPDSGPNYSAACVDSKAGFYKQVNLAAWQLRYYADHITEYNYQPNRWNYIQYNPDSSCGGQNVYIDNLATASLYIYTPYVPNAGALSAYPGTAYCGAYGNRNFFMFFTEWFGSTRQGVDVSQIKMTKDAAGQMFTKKPVTISFDVKNVSSYDYTFKYIGVAVRGPANQNMDPGWDANVTIHPGQSYTYKKVMTFTDEGEYKIYLSSFAAQDGDWRDCEINNSQLTCKNPIVIQNPIEVRAAPAVYDATGSVDLGGYIRQNQTFTAKYNFINTSALYNVKPGAVMLAVRQGGFNKDLQQMQAGSLLPGQQFTYQVATRYNDPVGAVYKAFITTTKDGGRTYEDEPFYTASGASQSSSFTMKSGVTLSQGVTIGPDQTVLNGVQTVQFKIKNYADTPIDLGRVGVAIQGPQGQNLDPLWQRVDSLAGGQELTYQASFRPNATGNWVIAFTSTDANMQRWNAAYPVSEDAAIKRTVTVNVSDPARLSEGPVVTDGRSYVNKVSTVRFKIKNTSNTPIDLGRVGVAIQGPQGQNLDPLWQRVDALPGGQEFVYQATFRPNAPGNWIVAFTSTDANMQRWNASYPASETSTIQRTITVNVSDQVTVTRSVQLTGNTLGSQTASVIITNHGDTDVYIGKLGLAIRDPQNQNRDALWEDFTVTANNSRTHSVGVTIDKVGNWTFALSTFRNGQWNLTYPVNDTNDIIRYLVVPIN